MSKPWVAEERPCLDPECSGHMEPELDGDTRYWACTTCGTEGHYELVRQAEPACQLGITEDTRKLLALAGRSIDIPVSELTEAGKVFLGADIPVRRPE